MYSLFSVMLPKTKGAAGAKVPPAAIADEKRVLDVLAGWGVIASIDGTKAGSGSKESAVAVDADVYRLEFRVRQFMFRGCNVLEYIWSPILRFGQHVVDHD